MFKVPDTTAVPVPTLTCNMPLWGSEIFLSTWLISAWQLLTMEDPLVYHWQDDPLLPKVAEIVIIFIWQWYFR